MSAGEANEQMINIESSPVGRTVDNIHTELRPLNKGVNFSTFLYETRDPMFRDTAESYILDHVAEGLNAIKVWSAIKAEKPYPNDFAKGLAPVHLKEINGDAHTILGICLAMGEMLHTYDSNKEENSIPREPIINAQRLKF